LGALARAVAGLLTRGGWFVGLLVLETLILAGFWASGQTPFGPAFDRRSAEADLLLLGLSTLPALLAGALLTAGDREDGMADFYRSCRVSGLRQIGGTGLGLFGVLGGALALALPLSLAVTAPGVLVTASPWTSLMLGLASTATHAAWGLFLGAWARSRLGAVALSLAFWVVTVFALEALVTPLVAVLPLRWGLPVLSGFLLTDPAELFRVAAVILRGQGWAYGPLFQEMGRWWTSGPGLAVFALLIVVHVTVPLAAAVTVLNRRSR